MSIGIIFAISAALLFGLWTVFHDQASNFVSPVLGAMLISLTAVIVSLPFLLREVSSDAGIHFTHKGLIFVALTGIAAFALDYLVLRTYSSGVAVSIAGPIIIGGSIAVAVIIGLFLGDHLTFLKAVGITLVISGAALLASLN